MGREQLIGPATTYIAGELRAARGRLQLTMEQLAEASGVAKTTVNRAFKGETAIAIEPLLKLCAALKIDMAELLDEAQRQV